MIHPTLLTDFDSSFVRHPTTGDATTIARLLCLLEQRQSIEFRVGILEFKGEENADVSIAWVHKVRSIFSVPSHDSKEEGGCSSLSRLCRIVVD